jgi:hypothetical protein
MPRAQQAAPLQMISEPYVRPVILPSGTLFFSAVSAFSALNPAFALAAYINTLSQVLLRGRTL